jgi:PTH2 family peptidyl-tRNA hydrolase
MNRIKQVILIRKDLKMRRGKEIAQGSHASMEFLLHQVRNNLPDRHMDLSITLMEKEKAWILLGMAKVCLRVNSEEELLKHHEKARAGGLKSYLIQDSGRTEFHGRPTFTACAIGPDDEQKIDAVTGDLVPY